MKEAYSDIRIFKHKDKLENIEDNILSAPIMVRIKPTNACNHNCYYCSTPVKATYVPDSTDTFKKGDYIHWGIMKDLLRDLHDMGIKSIILSGGGEPLLYKKALDTIKLIHKYDIDLGIITTGEFIKGEIYNELTKAKWVRISMDACSAKRYSKIRGVPPSTFDTICDNIEKFAYEKNEDCELGINYVVHEKNYDQVYEMALMVKYLGVNHIKYTPIVDKNKPIKYHNKIKKEVLKQIKDAEVELNDEKFRVINKYEDELKSTHIFKRPYRKCYIQQIVSSIAADSKVYLCHDKAYMKGSEIGDLKINTFKKIWYSQKTKDLFDTFDPRIHCQHHCVWDNRNMLINNYMDLEDSNKNFI